MIMVFITVFFKDSNALTNAYISTLDSTINDGHIFMGIGGILFLICIIISQSLTCGKNRKPKKKMNTETDMEIASDGLNTKIFKDVEERKTKHRNDRRRKVLAAEAPNAKKGDQSSMMEEEEEESPPEKTSATPAPAAIKKKKPNEFVTTEEDGYAYMTPKNWKK